MAEMIPEYLLDDVARRFRVLGDTTRLAMLRMLLQRGEMTVGDLAEAIGFGQANVSKHLRLLAEAQVVARRQQGTTVYVSVIDDTITRLCDIVCDRLQEQAETKARVFANR
jgi:ArsR family transcriptional regulator